MTYFELFQESPALFFLVIVISLVVTLLVYGAFPVIFSKTRKTPITKKKYKGLCYGINAIGLVFFVALNGASNGAPYLLWTWIFSNYGIKTLTARGLLSDTTELIEELNNPDITSDDALSAILKFQAKTTIDTMEANANSQPDNESDEDFGLVPEKPIFTLALKSVDGEEEYLDRLRTTGGERIKYTRRGSTSAVGINGMIDIYDTFLPNGQPYRTIYINMYGATTSSVAPKGFKFASKKITSVSSSQKGTDLSKSQASDRFIGILNKYRKFIVIALIASIVLVIISSIVYTLLDDTMFSANLHYDSTGNMNFVGCGSDACPYCQGASMLKSKYKGPYSFPYYSSISNTRMFFETTTVIFAVISAFLVALLVLHKIKKNKS